MPVNVGLRRSDSSVCFLPRSLILLSLGAGQREAGVGPPADDTRLQAIVAAMIAEWISVRAGNCAPAIGSRDRRITRGFVAATLARCKGSNVLVQVST